MFYGRPKDSERALFYTRQPHRDHGLETALAILVEHDHEGRVLHTFCTTAMALTYSNTEQGAMASSLALPLSLAISTDHLHTEVLHLAHMVLGSDFGVRDELKKAFLERRCVPPVTV